MGMSNIAGTVLTTLFRVKVSDTKVIQTLANSNKYMIFTLFLQLFS